MKRKPLSALLAVLMLSGCVNARVADVFVTPVKQDTENNQYLYTPGVYIGSAQGYGGKIEVEVTVDEMSIRSIVLLSSAESDYEIVVEPQPAEPSEPSEDEEEEPAEETEPQIITIQVIGMMDSVINEILATQSLDIQPDMVTGATVSCKALIEAIQQALTQASLQ